MEAHDVKNYRFGSQELFALKEENEAMIAHNEELIALANQGAWQAALTAKIANLEEHLTIEGGNLVADYQARIASQIAIYKRLAELNLAPDTTGAETQGWPFVLRMMDLLFPIIFVVCLLVTVTTIFTISFFEKLDLEQLYPTSRQRLWLQKIIFSLGVGFILYLSILLGCFLLASLLNGRSSLAYPINFETDNHLITMPVGKVLLQGLVLQFLSLTFLVLLPAVVTFITKQKMPTLFFTAFTLVGGVALTGQIVPLYPVIHLLPTTYFKAVSVVSNQLTMDTQNSRLSFSTGLVVMMVWTIVLGLMLFVLEKGKGNKQALYW